MRVGRAWKRIHTCAACRRFVTVVKPALRKMDAEARGSVGAVLDWHMQKFDVEATRVDGFVAASLAELDRFLAYARPHHRAREVELSTLAPEVLRQF